MCTSAGPVQENTRLYVSGSGAISSRRDFGPMRSEKPSSKLVVRSSFSSFLHFTKPAQALFRTSKASPTP